MSARTTSAGAPLIFVSAICYGLNAPAAREAALLGVGGADIVALRNALMFVGLGLFAAATGASLATPRHERAALLGLGVTSAMVGAGYITAVGFIPVGVAVMVFYTYPLLILIISPLVDGRRPSGLGLAAFALAFVGIALAVGSGTGGLDPRGLALAAIASLGAAAQSFFAARAPGGGGVATVFWAQATMIPIGVALAYGLGGPAPAAAWRAAAWPAAITIALYMGAYMLHMRGMRSVSPAAAGMIFCLEPVVAIAGAAILLGERLSGAQYIGAALVVAGVALDVAQRARASAPNEGRS